jgi:hypothetical protein
MSLSTRGLAAGEYKVTRFLSDFGDDTLLGMDPWSNWHKLKTYRGGVLGRIATARRPVILHSIHLENDEAMGHLLVPYNSLMAIPLFDDGKPLNWAIVLDDQEDGFSVEQLEESILRANLIGSTVRNALIAKQLRKASGWIQREVDQIASIQRSLLPAGIPDIPSLEIATRHQKRRIAWLRSDPYGPDAATVNSRGGRFFRIHQRGVRIGSGSRFTNRACSGHRRSRPARRSSRRNRAGRPPWRNRDRRSAAGA